MKLYRVVSKRENAVLTGVGAARAEANRWNSIGTEIIYTSESKELAIAEISSYVPIGLFKDPHVLVIEVEPQNIKELSHYPDNWDEIPPGSRTKKLGDSFVHTKDAPALRVKSRHGTSSSNVLLNPNYPNFGSYVKIVDVLPIKAR